MSCTTCSTATNVCDSSAGKVTIIRGSDAEISIRLVNKSTSEPFDLTGASQIKAVFIKKDETVLEKLMSPDGSVVITSALAGKLKVLLTEADTTNLKLGDEQSFEVEVTIGSVTTIVQFVGRLVVVKRVFDTSDT